VSDYIQDNVVEVVPENNEIKTDVNGSYYYDHLIIASGTQPMPGKTPGLLEALEDEECPVGSIYLPKYAVKYSQLREDLNQKAGGRPLQALFTQPSTPIKCGGAPQKILHLSHETWNSQNLNVEYSFMSGTPSLFGVSHYVPKLQEYLEKKNVNISLNSELINVDGQNKRATFKNMTTGETFQKEFDILHATPMNIPPEFITKSGLASANGYVDVNIHNFMHQKHNNIWAIGDSANLPTSKTNSAVNAQIWVLANNLADLKRGVPSNELVHRYEGYSACPVLVGDEKVMICEFGYDGEPRNSFKVLSNTEGWSLHYVLKTALFPLMNKTNANVMVNWLIHK
jgi:sulfide:quinone oxidoreductase